MTAFPSIHLEGGLLGADLLDQLLAADLPGQKPADFGLEARRNLTDEIAALSADARTLWGLFQNRLARLRPDDSATTVTRDAWIIPFLGLLGYELRYNPKAYEVDGLSFAISHRAGEGEDAPPVHIVGAGQPLEKVPPSGRPRLAPHSLIQEYLNRTDQVWGLVTNGRILRLLRDSTFIRRQAYVEFDLEALLEEQRFEDFVVLYRLLHRSRLPRGQGDAGDCLLEKYHAHAEEQGGRVREHLREGVEECITRLANGFLRHPANEELRRRVSRSSPGNGRITDDALYRQLLRLVYRFLFLLVSEDRDLLSRNPFYREHYSVGRLRRLLDQRAAFSEHDDLWQSLRVLWQVLAEERFAPYLDLVALNGELFSPQDLDQYSLTNRDLLEAFWHLAWYQEGRSNPRRVNYRALDVEELGSVYESLLEFHPAVDEDTARRPVFKLIAGSERKATGSYYTPPQLVAELIKSALEPVLAERLAVRSKEPERAILSIRVCDPACGSGHFLLAAARRLGKELARVRSGEEEPVPERVREAVRDVISHCIYGVDRNPLAVDLCRVALWLESHTGDKPLTFLDHRIRLGDSLVGVFDLTTLADGIPDEAFTPREGDDKATARALVKRNREERQGQMILGLAEWRPDDSLVDFTLHSREIDAIEDVSPEAIRRKKQLFEKSHHNPAWQREQEVCDLWVAAFFQPLRETAPAITSGDLADHLAGRANNSRLKALALDLSTGQRFFHWPLEFPEVFATGGFDVILSNPPWEQVELKEQEFFAARDARIANASTKAERTRQIKELEKNNPIVYHDFLAAARAMNAARLFLAKGGRYPLAGRGRINTYAVFAELAASLVNASGRAGLFVPTGIATDDTTKHLFGSLIHAGRLIELVGFENEEFLFPAVHHSVKFCKVVIGGVALKSERSRIAFYIRKFSQLSEDFRFFRLKESDFSLLNPNTGNCPVFRTRADALLVMSIYRRTPILWRDASENSEDLNPWGISFSQGLFNMASDSHHFRTAGELEADGYRPQGNLFVGSHGRFLPLYEAKMVHQFDHRFSTYSGATEKQLNVGILPQPSPEQKRDPLFVVQPRYWVREEVVESAIPQFPELLALALQVNHLPSVRLILCLWAAGYHSARGNERVAEELLGTARTFIPDRAIAKALAGPELGAHLLLDIERRFPLTANDAQAIADDSILPEDLARELVNRYSPKWFLGYRRVCRPTDERSGIFTAIPRVAVGDSEFLMHISSHDAPSRLAMLACVNSFCFDYVARQKIGGMNFSFFIIKQLPVFSPSFLNELRFPTSTVSVTRWILPRVLELVYTAHDLKALALECEYTGPPFQWDEERRFEIRCELDAAFFHLYLPSTMNGDWRSEEGEDAETLAQLKQHFPTPRDAAGFILDQFPIVRERDQTSCGSYRTSDRILEIYDAIQAARQSGRDYEGILSPPPGERGSIAHDSTRGD